MTPTPKIYLSNKELLREIHKSKLSFSWILDPKYTEYDLIVKDLTEIDINNVNEDGAVMLAKQQRADRKSAERWEKEITNWQESGSRGEKPKGAASRIPVESINTEDVVFRIMTYSQIPEEPGRKSKPKNNADIHTRLNFPPFKHYAFINNELTEVVRSHWQGDLQTGKFNTEHGKITDNLARMYIKLCERYSTRSNWRGYTYLDEMRCQALLQLTQIGLKFDESKSDNPFAYYTAVLTNSFTRIVNLEKKNQTIRDDLLIASGQSPSFSRQLEHEYAMVAEKDRAAALKENNP